MVRIDPAVHSVGLSKALESISIANVHIPLIDVILKGNRIAFVVYAIHDTDPIYSRIKDEDEEGMSDACRAVYFFIRKDRSIDYPRLLKAIKVKVQGAMRKQRKKDALDA